MIYAGSIAAKAAPTVSLTRRRSGFSREQLSLSTLLLAGTLAACSVAPVRDGEPRRPAVDPHSVEPGTPQVEPRSRYGNPASYEVFGKRYHVLESAAGYRERGIASWYGTKFHGRRTSSGEPYDMYALSAAHKSLPLPTWVKVTNLENGRTLVVRVNDRGPFHPGRIIDLSYSAAVQLGVYAAGSAQVEVESVDPARTTKRPDDQALDALFNDLSDHPVDDPVEAPPNSASFLQLGAFRKMTSCTELVAQLQQLGLGTLSSQPDPTGGPLCRVLQGPFVDPQAAQRAAEQARALGYPPIFVKE